MKNFFQNVTVGIISIVASIMMSFAAFAEPMLNVPETSAPESIAAPEYYQNPDGKTGWFHFDKWYYFSNGSVLTNRLSPDGFALDANGVFIKNNIDHAKYASESAGTQIIVFSKSAMRVEVWDNGNLIGTWPATSGRVAGDKNVEGDCKTPVGRFYLAKKVPNSSYTRGLLVSYPNIEDAERGLASGIISQNTYRQIVAANKAGTVPPQNTALGGMIEFHGNGQTQNATHGCIGLKDADIVQMYSMVRQGAIIDIIE